jgi:F-type H+-transporting ATPase subunit b
MRYITPFLFAVLSSPAWAASGPFVSLKNTNFIVLLSFLLFIGVLIYLKVPAMMGKLLDQRAEGIQADLDQARLLREEAQGILAEYERKQKEVQEQADRIVEAARAEAASAAAQGQRL